MARRRRAGRARRQRWTEEDAREALAALDVSEMSVAAFAQSEGVSAQKVHRWRRRLGASGEPQVVPATAPAFIEIRGHSPGSVEVVLRSRRVLRVSESIDASVLRRLADALEDTAGC